MMFQGIIIGAVSFLIIGVFHPIVIKTEYYIGKKAWPVFLVAGILCLGASLFVGRLLPSAILGVLGCTFLWSINELIEQEERVRKGWFPQNPARRK